MRWLVLAAALASASARAEIAWQPWDDAAFARARGDGKLVLVDVEAVWCHWCHVMDATTYHDPAVEELVGRRFVAVRVDQDARPDLAARWEAWGWPATIVLAPDGRDLARRRGYLEPAELRALLAKLAADPRPEEAEPPPPKTAAAALDAPTLGRLAAAFRGSFDRRRAGFGQRHKLVWGDPIELALTDGEADFARRTLDAALALLDGVWGGFYQYSATPDWRSPHFEKIMSVQADALRVYALGFARHGEARWLAAARAVARYLVERLADAGGAFHGSQDADAGALDGHAFYARDDAGRRAVAAPRVDPHLYARDNGLAIAGLCALADLGGDEAALAAARRAADWVAANRALPSGGYRHGEGGGADYLADTLTMGEAALRLYASTAERAWLARAEAAADYVARTFVDPVAGGAFAGAARPSAKSTDDNVALARFANLLHHYGGRAADRALAEAALRWLAAVAADGARPSQPGILLAAREAAAPPLHLTVVGRKDDPAAAALFAEGRRAPTLYKRVEWWDRREGPLPHADVDFPPEPEPAAYLCTAFACSRPSATPAALRAALARAAR